MWPRGKTYIFYYHRARKSSLYVNFERLKAGSGDRIDRLTVYFLRKPNPDSKRESFPDDLDKAPVVCVFYTALYMASLLQSWQHGLPRPRHQVLFLRPSAMRPFAGLVF